MIGGGQAQVEAKADFRGPDGKPLDPRGHAALRVSFEALDSQGKVIHRADAQPSPSQPALGATIVLPVQSGQAAPFTIRCVSEDRSSGVPFLARESQVVVIDPATAQRAPALAATSSIRARGGRAGEPLSCVVTVGVRDGTSAERQAFLTALKAQPPVVTARSALGTTFDTAANAKTFEVKSRIEADKALVMDLAWPSDPQPSHYEITVAEGEAGGVAYPAAQAAVRTVAADQLQLLVKVTRRGSKKVTLFDSMQQPPERGSALVGDQITVELVRGSSLDPREFVSLRGGLRALLIGEDGSVEEVPLNQAGDRFVTEPRVFAQPSRLHVQVNVAVEGLQIRFDGRVLIEPIALSLEVSQAPVFQTLAVLPMGTVTFLTVNVSGKIRKDPAGSQEVLEIIDREELSMRWSLLDSAGESVASERCKADSLPWRTAPRLTHVGDQSFALELVDRHNQVLDTIRWKFQLLEAPLQLEVATRSDDGELIPLKPDRSSWAWLPSWLTAALPVVVVAKPTQSPFYTAYYLAGLRIGQVDAVFNQKLGQHEADVEQVGAIECLGVFRPYGWGGDASATSPEKETHPELHVAAPLTIPPHITPRWGRLVLASVAVFLFCVVGSGIAAYCYRHRLDALPCKVRLLGASGQAMPVVEPDQPVWWPAREILVCQKRGHYGPPEICLSYPSQAKGMDVLARVPPAPGWIGEDPGRGGGSRASRKAGLASCGCRARMPSRAKTLRRSRTGFSSCWSASRGVVEGRLRFRRDGPDPRRVHALIEQHTLTCGDFFMESRNDQLDHQLSRRNGAAPDEDGDGPMELLQCPPAFIRAVGTYGGGEVRHFYSELKALYGGEPEHLVIMAIDTTYQPRLAGIEMLPPRCFINLGEQDQIQDRLRQSLGNPEVAEWMPKHVTEVSTGHGACGSPSAARFYYEQMATEVAKKLCESLNRFTPDNRPGMASRANLHPLLRAQNMAVTSRGPIEVIYVVSTTGGTVGALVYDVVLFKHALKHLGIEANFTLLLTLPATNLLGDVDSENKLRMLYGRFQELADLNAGRAVQHVAWGSGHYGPRPLLRVNLHPPRAQSGATR